MGKLELYYKLALEAHIYPNQIISAKLTPTSSNSKEHRTRSNDKSQFNKIVEFIFVGSKNG